MKESALDRFIRYARIDTQSQDDSNTYPSTKKQFDLLNLLVQELQALGIQDASIDEYGYVMATVGENLPKGHPAARKVPTIGLIAHVDTSPSASGAGVNPQVLTYTGGDIVLPANPQVVIRAEENRDLAENIGTDRHGGWHHAARGG